MTGSGTGCWVGIVALRAERGYFIAAIARTILYSTVVTGLPAE